MNLYITLICYSESGMQLKIQFMKVDDHMFGISLFGDHNNDICPHMNFLPQEPQLIGCMLMICISILMPYICLQCTFNLAPE